jgi:hypothetical protein
MKLPTDGYARPTAGGYSWLPGASRKYPRVSKLSIAVTLSPRSRHRRAYTREPICSVCAYGASSFTNARFHPVAARHQIGFDLVGSLGQLVGPTLQVSLADFLRQLHDVAAKFRSKPPQRFVCRRKRTSMGSPRHPQRGPARQERVSEHRPSPHVSSSACGHTIKRNSHSSSVPILVASFATKQPPDSIRDSKLELLAIER